MRSQRVCPCSIAAPSAQEPDGSASDSVSSRPSPSNSHARSRSPGARLLTERRAFAAASAVTAYQCTSPARAMSLVYSSVSSSG